VNDVDIAQLDQALARLHHAVDSGRSAKYCLRLWSKFVRLRDLGRCVVCDKGGRVVAHHIARKTFYTIARFLTGNGITLCVACHSEPHKAFNGRPDLDLPMDAEGGENIDMMMDFYRLLAEDAQTRGLTREDYYFLSDQVLDSFKKFQSISTQTVFPGTRVEQAYLIWRQTPRNTLNAFMKLLIGGPLPDNFIQRGPITLLTLPKS
jgi:hypothetical protein